jgi:hypothetical protein
MVSAVQQPEPDAKDWTWVLRERCPQCGFDAAAVERAEIGELTRDYAAVVADAARAPDAAVRPTPTTWSRLEYACHVRDVCSIFVARLNRMLAEDDPEFANWDQDATALEDEYWTQSGGLVAGQLTAAADTVADGFEAVPADQWQRPGRRSDGSAFSVDSLARYCLHDLAHHAHDVLTSAAPVSSPPGIT